jgi:ATP-dependent Lon protease
MVVVTVMIRQPTLLIKRLHLLYEFAQVSVRYLATVHALNLIHQSLDQLAEECPNFESVTTYIKRQIGLRVLGDKLVKFDPILLAGSPGTGKSYFARKLAQSLGVTMYQINFENEQMSAGLNGTSKHFSSPQPGIIFDAIVQGIMLNPLMFADELDKATKSNTNHGVSDPIAGLYQLLEPDQAKTFKDQSTDVIVDASYINWVFTANDLTQIPKPILNRLRVFNIETPSISQCEKIVSNMIDGITQSMGIADKSVFSLDSDALAALSAYIFEDGLSLRDMKRMVYDFMSDRANDATCALSIPEAKKEMRIGF